MEFYLDTIGERLRFLRQDNSLSIFAARFGVSKSTLGRYEKGDSQPDAQFLARVCRTLSICPQWLLMGGEQPCQLYVDYCSVDCDYPVAGCLVHNYASPSSFRPFMDFFQKWVVDQGFELEQLLLVRITEDTMLPTFNVGSLVLVDKAQNSLCADAIFALRQESKIIIRRLQQMVNGDLHVKTDNPHYEDQVLTGANLSQLNILGRVIWAGVQF